MQLRDQHLSNQVERLRDELQKQVVMAKGNLLDEKVLAASQALDKLVYLSQSSYMKKKEEQTCL